MTKQVETIHKPSVSAQLKQQKEERRLARQQAQEQEQAEEQKQAEEKEARKKSKVQVQPIPIPGQPSGLSLEDIDKLPGVVTFPEKKPDTNGALGNKVLTRKPATPKSSGPPLPDSQAAEVQWFHNAPTDAILTRLNNMKRHYDLCAQIVLQRNSTQARVWTCWSQTVKGVPRTVLNQCRKQVPDGKWVFKDDGAKDADGHLSPIVVCSTLCYQAYMSHRAKARQPKGTWVGEPQVPVKPTVR